MNISIFGLGYVGAVSLACLARDGHRVIGVDIDPAKLALIAAGKTPVVEEGMVDLMAASVASGRVSVSADVAAAVRDTEVSLVCVGTPSAPNGSQDQTAVMRLAEDIGRGLQNKSAPHVIVFRSTLTPGSVERVVRPAIERVSGRVEGRDFHLCFQPEFLREGSSIRDYDQPPFTVIGGRHPDAFAILRGLFGHLPCKLIETDVGTAEMVKYCCNNFHAVKITFANETARLCAALGVDPFAVMSLLCQDTQLNISAAYMRPGFAFGGSCLPKELRATGYLARQHDVDIPMLAHVLASNEAHLTVAVTKALGQGRRPVGMIGLSFKPGTDDLRESPLVALAERLIGKGLPLSIYDADVHLSQLLGANRRYIDQHLPHLGQLLRADLDEVIRDSDLLVVGQGGRVVIEALTRGARADQTILDLVRLPEMPDLKARVEGLCW